MLIMIIAILFLIVGIIFLLGKGGVLIAGYNTADEHSKAKYDIKKLNRCYAAFCIGIAVVLSLTGYVDTEEFAILFMLPALAVLFIFIVIATTTYCKKK